MYSIELDCPPGNPRPGDLIAGVLEGTGLKESDFETCTPFFGLQTWEVKKDREDAYAAVQPTIKERVTALYDSGVIRYGSW